MRARGHCALVYCRRAASALRSVVRRRLGSTTVVLRGLDEAFERAVRLFVHGAERMREAREGGREEILGSVAVSGPCALMAFAACLMRFFALYFCLAMAPPFRRVMRCRKHAPTFSAPTGAWGGSCSSGRFK